VIVRGCVALGSHNHIGAFSSLGDPPQDTKHDPAKPGRLVIGDNNQVREYCSLHSSTSYTDGFTSIGNNNYFMDYTHVAHDCRIGSNNTFANNSSMGGHVRIGNNTVLGAFAKLAQFTQVGSLCMLGAASAVYSDVPSYWLISGDRARAYGINRVGMRRVGLGREQIANLQKAFHLVYRPGPLDERRAVIIEQCSPGAEIDELLASLTNLRKGLIPVKRRNKPAGE